MRRIHLQILERRLVHHDPGALPLHHHVLGPEAELPLLQVELVLEARAAPALHTHPQPARTLGRDVLVLGVSRDHSKP